MRKCVHLTPALPCSPAPGIHRRHDLSQDHRLFRVQRDRLRGQDGFVRVRIAFGNLRADRDEALVLQLAHRLGRGAGEAEQFLERQLAPLFDHGPDILLALGQLRQLACARDHAGVKAFAPAGLLLAHGLGQNALERQFDGAAVVLADPARELEHLGGDGALLADDLGDGAEVRVRGLLDERRDHAQHLARAEGNFDTAAHLDPAGEFRRDRIVKFPAQGDFKGDARDHRS